MASAVKDAFLGKIVSYSIDSRMKALLAVCAIRNAVAMRGSVNGGIVHSDRGSQLRIVIVTCVERTYHRRRRQVRLGRLMQVEFETVMNKNLALAA